MDLEQYNKDSSVQGIIDYVVSYARFVHEYRKLTCNMPSDKILQRVAGEELPANLQGKSIRELAQRLRDRLQDESKKWCKSYRCINKFLTTGVQRANDLVVMQQITQGWSGRSAVDESKMKKALKLDDLEEAVKVLAEPRQDLIKEARTLLHNIHLSNPDFHTIYSEMESLVDTNRQLAEPQKKEDERAREKGRGIKASCAERFATAAIAESKGRRARALGVLSMPAESHGATTGSGSGRRKKLHMVDVWCPQLHVG